MKLIKPPKKKRLIASWRSYARCLLRKLSDIHLQVTERNDGNGNDVYICNNHYQIKQYVGSFKTTTVIRNKDDEPKCVCGEVSADQNIEIAMATGNWDCTINNGEHNFKCDHCSHCGVSKYDE